MKAGTRIEVQTMNMDFSRSWEGAVIMRRTKAMEPMPDGFHPVRFDADGARLLVHESGFRVVDNRA